MILKWAKDNPDALPDEKLMIHIGNGDRMAYRALVDRHLGSFLVFAARLVGDRVEAEDIIQEAFFRLWRNAFRWDPGRNVRFTTWFYRIVMNLSIDAKRKRKPVSSLDEASAVASDEATADEKLSDRQMAAEITRALQQLPERQRIVLTLCYLQGMANREAAQILDITVGAVESLLVRGRKRMALLLKAHGKEFLKESI